MARNGLAIVEPLVATRLKLAEREAERLRTVKELKSSEEELRNFFEASKDMIYTTNAEDRIASINAAGIALLGYENRFDVVGRTFSEFIFNPDDRSYFLTRVKDKGFVRDYEIIIKRPGNEPPVFCIETANAIKRPDGSVSAIQGIVKDISERISNEKSAPESESRTRRDERTAQDDAIGPCPAGKTGLDRAARSGSRPRDQQSARLHEEQFQDSQRLFRRPEASLDGGEEGSRSGKARGR